MDNDIKILLDGYSANTDGKIDQLSQKTDKLIGELSANTDRKIDQLSQKTDKLIGELSANTDRKIANFTDEIKRHFGVVVEGIDDQVKLIAEGHMDLVQRLDGIDGRLDKLEEKTEGIFEQVIANTEDLTMIKTDIGAIKSELTQKISYKEFSGMIADK